MPRVGENAQGLNRWQKTAPSLITAVRILLLPMIWVLWMHEHVSLSLVLYGLAVLSDWADGRVARKLGAASAFGAFFDVVCDVVFLLSLLLLLGLHGVVPIWLFLAPFAAAVAFFMTSKRTAPRYDPVGKHYGGVLFVVVGCLLCKPCNVLCATMSLLISILSVIVVVNRGRIGAPPPETVPIQMNMDE